MEAHANDNPQSLSSKKPQVVTRPDVEHCKDDRTAGRTKGVRHTCPELLKGRGEARYFAPKGTQDKEGVGKSPKPKD